MTVTSNPTAIAMITEMIDTNDSAITLNEQTLLRQLEELARMTETIIEQLEMGYGIESGWLREKAHRAEESIAKRQSLYENKASLEYVLRAAGSPDED